MLVAYFLFSEQPLPLFPILGASSAFLFSFLNLALQVYFYCTTTSDFHQRWQFQSKCTNTLNLRLLNLLVGAILCSLFLGLSQRESSVISAFPYFYLFMLLAIFSFLHTFFADILIQYLSFPIIMFEFKRERAEYRDSLLA